jgi:hypothetical protein
LALLFVAALGCDRSSSTATAAPAAKGKGAPVSTSKSKFDTAAAAFREYAVAQLASKDLELAPNGEGRLPAAYGGAWAFNAQLKSNSDKLVRGWATGDGTVITIGQNFGKLLVEAGLWAKPQGDLSKLPSALAWSLGNAYQGPGSPEVKLGADGAGTLKMYLSYQQAGGGGSLGPMVTYEVDVAFAKDHTATAKLVKL